MPLNKKMPIYPWICWLIVALFYFFQYGLLAMPSVLNKEFQTSFMIDATGVAVLYSAFLVTYVFMQIPVGLLFDRFRSRNLLLLAAALLVFGCMVLAVSNAFWLGVLGRMIMGVGGSFAFVGALYLGRSWFPFLLFPLIIGLTEAMSGLSEIGLLPVIAYLNKFQHWRVILLEFSMVIVVLMFLIFFIVRDRRQERTKKHSFDVKHKMVSIFGNRMMWLLSSYVGFMFVFAMSIANMWGAPLIVAFYHIPVWKAALETSMIMVGFTVGCFVIGWITRYLSDRNLMLYSSLIQFIGVSVFWYIDMNLFYAGVLFFIIGFVSSAIVVAFNYAKKIVPAASYGVASGFLNMFFGGFGILISPLVGYIFESTRSVFLAFTPTVACSFIAFMIALVLKYTETKPIAAQPVEASQ